MRYRAVERRELAKRVYESHGGLTHKNSVILVDQLFRILSECLKDGKYVKIHNFGTFRVVTRKPRRGRNPKTGVIYPIPSLNSVVFVPSSKLIVE